ncbi:MAG: hypothetical protein MUO59_07050, partial [Actinobacteria bacterium]|nr:hypothetical protein [Actinomycetota bacterium]
IEYQIYGDGAYIGSTPDLTYENIVGIDNYTFYVKILYEYDNLSVQSNSVITETPQPPENLTIDGYKWGGPNRAVTLSWTAPDTELAIIEYQICRDGLYIGSTTGLTYENLIGQTDYTFYVKILYEIDYLSDQSNTVTTN